MHRDLDPPRRRLGHQLQIITRMSRLAVGPALADAVPVRAQAAARAAVLVFAPSRPADGHDGGGALAVRGAAAALGAAGAGGPGGFPEVADEGALLQKGVGVRDGLCLVVWKGVVEGREEMLTRVGRHADTMPLLISMIFQAQGSASDHGTSSVV